jgi:hypothetical protein
MGKQVVVHFPEAEFAKIFYQEDRSYMGISFTENMYLPQV